MIPQDVQHLIFSDIKHGQTFKAIVRLNKLLHDTYKSRKYSFMNQLLTLVKRYPDKDWNWFSITSNPTTPTWYIEEMIKEWEWIPTSKQYYDIVNRYIGIVNALCNTLYVIYDNTNAKKWNWYGVSLNPNITPSIIEKYPTILWDWQYLSSNPNININFVKNNLDKPWNWWDLTINKGISLYDIENHPDLPWVIKRLPLHPDTIIGDSLNPSITKYGVLNGSILSRNPNITENFIEAHPGYDWQWDVLSSHPNTGINFIKAHMDYNWDWYQISRRIPLEDLWDYRDYEDYINRIDFEGLSQNPTLTDEFVKNHPDVDWDFVYLCANKGISFKFLKDDIPIYRGIYWKMISSNPKITIDYIEANINEDWNWVAISECRFEY